jgi:GT2 family glycosyltransferase
VAIDVIVVDNGSTDGTAELVAAQFPSARIVRCENHGFGHANNRGLETCDARYVLFLNCDTEVLDGTFAELVRLLDARPHVGIAGTREVLPDGSVYPTMRRFPSAGLALAEALSLQRLPFARGLGEVQLDAAYEREASCDWTSGASMVIRREAVNTSGAFDERFFMSAEDIDLCRRVRDAGFEIIHLPSVTVMHHVHGGDRDLSPRMAAQYALSRRLYALKHFSRGRRFAYLAAMALRYGLRTPFGPPRRSGMRERVRELGCLLRLQAGRGAPPFEPVPPAASREPPGQLRSSVSDFNVPR